MRILEKRSKRFRYYLVVVLFFLVGQVATAQYTLHTPYPIIFIHGLNSNYKRWSNNDEYARNTGRYDNVFDYLTGRDNLLKYGGNLNITLDHDRSTTSLSNSKEDDVWLFDQNPNFGDFYTVNFDVNALGVVPSDIPNWLFETNQVTSIYISSNETEIGVTIPSQFYVGDIICIGDEYMEVIGIGNTTITVNRHKLESTAGTHILGDYVWNLSSESNQASIVKQGFGLKKAIDAIKLKTGAKKVILVGHSMGGLAAREYIRQFDGADVAKLVTIGTPHLGSTAADILNDIKKIVGIDVSGLKNIDARSDAIRDLSYNYTGGDANSNPLYGDSSNKGIYLFGGDSESFLDSETDFYNPDVNANSIIETDIQEGLNTNILNSLPPTISYSWIISDLLAVDGDGCVRYLRQYPWSEKLPVDFPKPVIGNIITTNTFHTKEPTDYYALLRGLDEPEEKDLAYTIGENSKIRGFITYQQGEAEIDNDLYKIVITEDGMLNMSILANSHSSVNKITLLDNSSIEIQSTGNINETITINVKAGVYFVKIQGTATDISYQYPYTLQTSFAKASDIKTAVISYNIGETTAVCGGNIISNGGATITASGLVYSKTPAPTLATGTVVSTSPVVEAGTYSLTMNGLEPDAKYYVRAYATNSIGTCYGEEISFTATSISTSSYTLTDADVVVTEGVIQSCSYDFVKKIITIPETLDGQTVVGIVDNYPGVFEGKGIVKINLPNTLKTIGSFYDNKLTSLTLPNSITTIENAAFSKNQLSSLTIPNSVTSIGNAAFSSNQLTNVTIPTSVTSIGIGAFSGNTELASITLPVAVSAGTTFLSWKDNYGTTYAGGAVVTRFELSYTAQFDNTTPQYSITGTVTGADGLTVKMSGDATASQTVNSGGTYSFTVNSGKNVVVTATKAGYTFAPDKYSFTSVTANKTGNDFVATELAPYTLTDADVVVINGVIQSCSYTFTSKRIIIPETLDGQTVVGIVNDYIGVFREKGIVNITLPNTLKTIGGYAFFGNQLTNITIPNSVLIIDEWAFNNNQLTSVTIPNSVTLIGASAFSNNQLTSVTIPNSVITIGDYAFIINDLTDVIIPNSVTRIGANAFEYNSGLTSITLPTPLIGRFINWIDSRGNTYPGGTNVTDFSLGYTAQIEYTLTDADVVVANGIIQSCSYNFAANCITIPETLDGQTVIGVASYIFSNKLILKIILPNTLTTIGESAFSCNKLTSIVIPNRVTTIGDGAFSSNCLSSVIIPNSVSKIGYWTFSNNMLTSITIPNSVVTIGQYAFYNNQLNSVSIPNSVTRIENNAFSGNSGLTSITLPTPVISGRKFLNWMDSNWNNYAGEVNVTNFSLAYAALSEYTLTDADVVVTGGFIRSCSCDLWATSVIIPETLDGQTVVGIAGSYYDDGVFRKKGIIKIMLPNTLKTIGGGAFYGNPFITNVTIPNSVRTIGAYAFGFYNTPIDFPGENNGLNGITTKGVTTSITLPTPVISGAIFINWIGSNNGSTCAGGANLTDFTQRYRALIEYTLTDADVAVTDGVIQSCSYKGEANSIIIPETLAGQTVIGIADKDWESGVFKEKGIIKIKLPSTLKSIGSYSFNSNDLRSVTIPNSVTSIGFCAFAVNSLTSVTIGNSVTTIGEASFVGNYLTSLVIPNSVKTINERAFDNNRLTSVTIGNSVTTIGENAFRENQLTSITLPNSVTRIGAGAFVNNSGLISITLPTPVVDGGETFINWIDSKGITYPGGANVTDLSLAYTAQFEYTLTDADVVVTNGVIQSCSYNFAATCITIPETLDGQTVIGIADRVFNSKWIVKITLPNSLKSLDNYAFSSNKLTSIAIPNRVTTIGGDAFSSNCLSSVIIPNSVTMIGAGAFVNNSGLISITLPTPVVDGGETFINWIDSKGITYPGGANITDFSLTYTAQFEYTLTDADVIVTDGVIQSCSYNFAANCIIIPETLDGQTVIGIADKNWGYGVFDNKAITKITLPNTLKTIGNYSFFGNQIKSLTIPNSVTTIGEYSFAANSLSSVTIGNSVTIIGEGSFIGNRLTSVVIPNRVTTIGDFAFYNNQLTNITIPISVTLIGGKAFSENFRLSSLTLPESVSRGIKSDNWKNGNGIIVANNTTVTDFSSSYTAQFIYPTYSITGTVTGIVGVTIALSGDVTDSKTVNNGETYSFTVNYGQSVVVSASKPGYSFAPSSYTFTSVAENKSTNNFVASINPYTITGTVTGADGVTVALSGDVTDSKTVNNGETYSFNVNYGQSVVVTASKSGYSFAPGNYTLTNVTENKAANNFVASINTYSITGTVTGADGVTVALSGDVTGSKTVNDGETYSFTVNNGQSVVVTASKDGYFFAPVSYTLANITENKAANNFGASEETSYTLTDADVEVIGGIIKNCSYDFSIKNIIIPETLDGQTILGIEGVNWTSGVFQNKGIREIKLPNTLISIGARTLSGNQLTSVTIPNSVTTIGWGAFANNKLNNITIPNGVTAIEPESFFNNLLTSVSLPNSITSIAFDAFSNNSGLLSITLPEADLHGIKSDGWKSGNGLFIANNTVVTDFSCNYKALFSCKISGTVTGIDGVTVALSGDVTGSQTVNNGGTYSFNVNQGQSVVVTASKSGYSFEPGSYTFTNVSENKTANNFSTTYTVTGSLTGTDGVTVALSGDVTDSKTVNNGETYSFNVNYGQSVVVTASKPGYSFAPSSYALTNVTENKIASNFVASLNPYTITGTVTGIDGVTVAISGDVTDSKTVNNGETYSFTVNYGQSVVVTASKPGYSFAPGSYALTNVTENKIASNFVASLNPYTITGTVTGIDGVTVAISGDVTDSKTVNNGETYSFTVNYGQSVVVTASKPGYSFAPGSYALTNVTENKIASNFVASLNPYTITGTVTGIDGVTVAIIGNVTDSKTVNNGETYSFTVNYGQSVVVAASKPGYSFVPGNYTLANVTGNKTTNNFVASVNPFTIAGTISGADGVTVALSGDVTDSKTVNNGCTYSFNVNYGQSVVVTASKPGYSFVTGSYTLANVTGNKTANNFVASLNPPYTITYIVDYIQQATATVEHGAKATVPLLTKAGYHIDGWYQTIVGLDEIKYDFNTPVTSNLTLRARWVVNTYTITGTVTGTDGVTVALSGDVTDSKTVNNGETYSFNVNYGQSVVVTASKPGCSFVPGSYTFTNVTDSKTGNNFVASINPYTITGTVTGADGVTVTLSGDVTDSKTVNNGETYSFNVNYGQSVVVTASKPGCSFVPGSYTLTNVTENKTANNFVASINPYTITGTVTGADGVTVTLSGDVTDSKTVNNGETYSFNVNYGQSVVVTASKPGCSFVPGSYTLTNVTENKTANNFVASLNPYTITFIVDNVQQSTATVEHGAKAIVPVLTKSGYHIDGWYQMIVGLGEIKYDFNTSVTSNLTLRVRWVINTYTVTGTVTGVDGVTVALSGDVTDSKTVNNGETYSFTMNYGQSVVITASKPGCSFVPGSYTLANITENKIANNFVTSVNPYTITGTVTGVDGVTVALSGDVTDSKTVNSGETYSFNVNYGQSVVVTASKPGYSFVPGSYTLANVTGNKTANNFVASVNPPYTITYIVDNVQQSTATVEHGAKATVPVLTKAGYHFDGWFVGLGEIKYDFNTPVTSNLTLWARWVVNTYTITGTVTGVDGVTVALSGDVTDSKTVNNGETYSFNVNYGQSVVVTASKPGCSFVPGSYTLANVTGNKTTNNFVASVNSFTIAGTISGADGVTVALSGDVTDSKTVNNGETYSFTVNYGQSVVVTASKPGYSFVPGSYTLTNVTGNKTTNNFVASVNSFTIAGTISGADGVTVALSGDVADSKTVNNGETYSFNVNYGQSVVVTASKPGYSFVPGSYTLTNVTENKSTNNFVASVTTSVDNCFETNISCYPNPVKSTLIIKLPANDEIVSVQICSITGDILYWVKDTTSKNFFIDVNGYPSGVLLVRITNNKEGVAIIKIIKLVN